MHSPYLIKFNISMLIMRVEVNYCFYFLTIMPYFDVRDRLGVENFIINLIFKPVLMLIFHFYITYLTSICFHY